VDLWLRWVDELESQQVDAYSALDVRVAWSPSATLSLAAVARNLFAGDHLEFMSELVDLAPVRIEPEGYIELRWSF
ncbi:MAG: TonB-dependent receptor, partial [Gammaproteobacteria bacterium]|nr:TonB-dependent receptor [Gammaproteobacteria bacterium]